jgi:hypothetical protein
MRMRPWNPPLIPGPPDWHINIFLELLDPAGGAERRDHAAEVAGVDKLSYEDIYDFVDLLSDELLVNPVTAVVSDVVVAQFGVTQVEFAWGDVQALLDARFVEEVVQAVLVFAADVGDLSLVTVAWGV